MALLFGLIVWSQTIAPISAATSVRRDLPAEASRVHLVLLGYTPANGFGDACRRDIIAVEATLRAGFREKSDRIVTHELSVKNPRTGAAYTTAEVEQYLRSMEVGRNEIVIVYHSGHGKITNPREPESSHVLEFNGGEISRGTIMRLLQAKNPRGLIVLTDCCSAFGVSEELEFVSFGGPTVNAETIQNLFLRMTGVVSITAAQDGTYGIVGYSGGNPGFAGSAFTVALLRLTFGERSYVSWKDFFPSLCEETFAASSGRTSTPHRPRYFRLSEGR